VVTSIAKPQRGLRTPEPFIKCSMQKAFDMPQVIIGRIKHRMDAQEQITFEIALILLN